MSKRRRHLSQHHVLIVIFISETIKSIFIEFTNTMRTRKSFCYLTTNIKDIVVLFFNPSHGFSTTINSIQEKSASANVLNQTGQRWGVFVTCCPKVHRSRTLESRQTSQKMLSEVSWIRDHLQRSYLNKHLQL